MLLTTDITEFLGFSFTIYNIFNINKKIQFILKKTLITQIVDSKWNFQQQQPKNVSKLKRNQSAPNRKNRFWVNNKKSFMRDSQVRIALSPSAA